MPRNRGNKKKKTTITKSRPEKDKDDNGSESETEAPSRGASEAPSSKDGGSNEPSKAGAPPPQDQQPAAQSSAPTTPVPATQSEPAAGAAQPTPMDEEKKPDDKKKPVEEVELSEEDKLLKEKLEALVQTVSISNDAAEQQEALLSMGREISASTSSMTAVPKPLKFLRVHYEPLCALFANMPSAHPNRAAFADVLSVLAMTSNSAERQILRYKLQGTRTELGVRWGHEYIRGISREIGLEFAERHAQSQSVDDLMGLVMDIVPFNMDHHAEGEAVDLLSEVGSLPMIVGYCTEENYMRVTQYLTAEAQYVMEPEDKMILKVVYDIYRKLDNLPLALRIAMRINSKELITESYEAAQDLTLKRQLALELARQNQWIEAEGDDDLQKIMGNGLLSEHFQALAHDLDIREAKAPEDVYKSHLETVSKAAANVQVDSARKNLASTFVNAFVNAGFQTDKLMTVEGSDWVYKNKEHGMMSAVASLGMIKLWDFEAGMSEVDRFTYSEEPYVVAGAMLATGLVNAGIRTSMNAALSLMEDHLAKNNDAIRAGVLIGGAIAEGGHENAEAIRMFLPLLTDSSLALDVVALAGLSLSIIFVASGNSEVSESIVATIMDRAASEADVKSVYFKILCLALGLLYLGHQDTVDVVLVVLETLPDAARKVAVMTLETCAYTATGSVLQIQRKLHACCDHLPEGEGSFQAIAVLGIALIAMGEDLSAQMAVRSFGHILQYGEVELRRVVPLALAMLYVSDPKLPVMDTLSKLSHDTDAEVSQNAVLALGMVGAGTNNARIAGMLRELAAYYSKEANHLFVVRIAQGLLYMGKGTMTINPFHSDRLLQRNVATAGLMAVVFACLDMKTTILGKAHYILYFFALAMRPRMLMTFDENMKQVKIPVRVGEAVDTVGQAGKPKTIIGFQTHDTPVLLDVGQRAEFVNDQYIPMTPILEGAVMVRLNPAFEEGQHS